MTEVVLLIATGLIVRYKIKNEKKSRQAKIENRAFNIGSLISQPERQVIKADIGKFYEEHPDWHKLSLPERKVIIENRIKDKRDGNTSNVN